MRWNLRSVFIFTCIIISTILLLLRILSTGHDYVNQQHQLNCPVCPATIIPGQQPPSNIDDFNSNLHHIPCYIEGNRKLQCIADNDDVYIPFEKFLRRQYDITGKISTDQRTSETRFDWTTSYSKVRRPPTVDYDPLGPFGHFASYNVESRDRVRCISAIHGVPMSTQWASDPYFYPIQIAQYALQHYSRNTTEPIARSVTLGELNDAWNSAPDYGKSSKISQRFDTEIKEKVLDIISEAKLENPGVFLSLDHDPELHVLQFGWHGAVDSSFTVIVELIAAKRFVKLNYVRVDDSRCVWPDEETPDEMYSYALGAHRDSAWRTVTRDLLVDVGRALLVNARTTNGGGGAKSDSSASILHVGDIRLISLGFRGQSTVVQRVSQRTSAHMELFLTAADWFLNNQDKDGGWSVPVERSIADKRLILEAGWHSAMAQGHAISVLTRAFAVTTDRRYLDAAEHATRLFDREARDGGIRNTLFGIGWFEEYPTQPGSYVLNGFIYALIGLYDLSRQQSSTATRLFNEGIESLNKLLPLYDTGSGSIYDLRHVTLHVAPNLARWDYHAVHIYQLLWLYNIDKKQTRLKDTAERWISYAYGHRAKHN